MPVQIAPTFLNSMAKLDTKDKARAVDFLARFVAHPAERGLRLEPVREAPDGGLWSARVHRQIRAIVHRSNGTWVLLFVGWHDLAYRWALRRRVKWDHAKDAVTVVEVEHETIVTRESATIPVPGGPGRRDPDMGLIELGEEEKVEFAGCLFERTGDGGIVDTVMELLEVWPDA